MFPEQGKAAVDRQALADAIREGHDEHAESAIGGCWANAQKIADYVLASGVLDAALHDAWAEGYSLDADRGESPNPYPGGAS